MSTTTFALVRNQAQVVLESVTPTTQPAVKFRRHRDEVDFFDWCGTNKAACLRRFEVRGGTGYGDVEITNAYVEFHRTMLTVQVAYPMEFGKYGPKNRASLEKAIEEDMHLIDDTLGARGMGNWVAGSWMVKKGEGETAEQDGVMYLRMTFEVGIYRSV